MATCSLRPSTILGRDDYQLVPAIQACIEKFETPFIIGSGNNLYDFTYVENVAQAHVLAVENLLSTRTAAGEAILISNDQPITFRDFMLAIWAHWDHTPPFEVVIPARLAWAVGAVCEAVGWMTGTRTTLCRGSVKDAIGTRYCSQEKAQRLLGYHPKVDLWEGLRISCDVSTHTSSFRHRPANNDRGPQSSTGGRQSSRQTASLICVFEYNLQCDTLQKQSRPVSVIYERKPSGTSRCRAKMTGGPHQIKQHHLPRPDVPHESLFSLSSQQETYTADHRASWCRARHSLAQRSPRRPEPAAVAVALHASVPPPHHLRNFVWTLLPLLSLHLHLHRLGTWTTLCNMTCSVSVITSYEEPATLGSSTSASTPGAGSGEPRHRRRHSSYHARSRTADYENVQQLVDRFLAELNERLGFLESFGTLTLDGGIDRAWTTLHAVRDSCAKVSDDLKGAGQRRARVFVDTLEDRYKGALATRDSLELKVQEGVKMMDDFLTDLESRAYAVRDAKLAAAGELLDEGWRKVDEGMGRAKEVVDRGIDRARRAQEVLKANIESAIVRAREHGLIRYEDLPDPWRCNPHIMSGYRFSETKLDCIKSILGFSNESFNIWSHLLGLILVLSIAFYFYPTTLTFSLSSKADVLIAGMFFLAACKCLVCSTMWHTMCSISSQSLMERFACVDYTGISLLVATSIMTTEYTAFYCEPVSRWTWMLSTFALGVGGTILPWHPTFNRVDMSWLRVGFFVGLGATGFLPVAQITYTRGAAWALYFYAPIAKSLVVYLTGAFLYASKVPERWFPGCFDYVGGSHNIWHVAVLGGILFHYSAMNEFFKAAFLRATAGECSVY